MRNRLLTSLATISFFLTNQAFGQNVGIGEPNPGSKLSVKGGMSVGSTYSSNSAPNGGLIIEGRMGIGTLNPDTNAILDMNSSTKGIKFPNISQTARAAITNPSKGLVLFDTDSNNIYFHNGSSWQSLVNLSQVTNLVTSTITNLTGGLLGGGSGSTWYTGTAAPTILTTGNTNDLYLNTTTGDYYKKTILGWTFQATLSGATGHTGATGATGAAGSNGTNGAAGAAGATGATGHTGATGTTGATGAAGATGTAGTNGTNGAAGATGATGAAGTNGTNGATGAAGTNGTNGAAGATGATGAAGTNGINGAAGATGATGAAGSAGTNGSTWLTGTVAPTGGQGSINDLYLNTA
ncbi:MAG: phage tail fiber protein, partial [Bacteroidota bacterium]|nr:phage tail fiber protein [Bacteroidota bacterium]